MKYYLGLDNGGTVTKAAIFTSDGKEVGTAGIDTAVITPRPGFIERDMEEMWEANCTVIREVLKKTGINSSDISAVAVCGHGKGIYLWGKDNKPSRNGIMSTDNRAYKYPIKWEKDGTAEKVFKISAQSILACQPVSLLAWIKDNEPEVYGNIQWIFECKDYIRFRLTGEAKGELTDYSGANLINLYTKNYDKNLLDLFGISEMYEALPKLCTATEICGYITEETEAKCGLKAGTPVAGGMFDIDACCLAVNVIDERNICMIAGTWSINEYLRRSPVIDGSVLMNSLFCIPDYYLVEECSATSAGNNQWFIKNMLPELIVESKKKSESIYSIMNEWVMQIPDEEFCPIFLPFLVGSNVHANAKAAFVGISGHHNRKHIVRSIYEGIAFSHKYHLNRLLETKESPTQCIRLAGGVTNSDVWVQIFANIMELPIEIVGVKETGASGCAITAAVTSGDYSSLKEAAEAMCKISKRVNPEWDKVGIYREKYRLYLKTIQCLDGVWDNIQYYMESIER